MKVLLFGAIAVTGCAMIAVARDGFERPAPESRDIVRLAWEGARG